MKLAPERTLPIKYATMSPRGENIEFYGVSRAHVVCFSTLHFLSLDSCAVFFPVDGEQLALACYAFLKLVWLILIVSYLSMA